jgi:hypothetical protein
MTAPGHQLSPAVAASGPKSSAAARTQYGTIVIVGGGCYGSYYVRQLDRASRAHAVEWQRLVVVDRDEHCAVARSDATRAWPGHSTRPEITIADWREFFEGFLGSAVRLEEESIDAIVPSPLMPHLMYEWLLDRGRRRWPDREVSSRPLPIVPPMPWERASPDGTHYVSFAEWICPVNCIEPAICPHTRGDRSWSMPPALKDYVADAAERGSPLSGPLLFHCTHRAYGVGMIDVADVIAADRFVARAGAHGQLDVLVGTVSHCHGALNVMHVERPPARSIPWRDSLQ